MDLAIDGACSKNKQLDSPCQPLFFPLDPHESWEFYEIKEKQEKHLNTTF